MDELIEKLKKNERGWMFLSDEEQRCLEKVSKEGKVKRLGSGGAWDYCVVGGGAQKAWPRIDMYKNDIWRISPDYEPEPEYIDLEIFKGSHKRLLVNGHPLDGPTAINKIVCHPDFDGFQSKKDNYIGIENVAQSYRDGEEPFARFIKE